MIDRDLPQLKHRWNEAHEVGHSIIPWHDNLLLGDNEFSLNPNCHQQMEAEANFAAGQLLFLQDRFAIEAKDTEVMMFETLKSYCGYQRGGPLGQDEVVILDDNRAQHLFHFESFSNTHDVLTLVLKPA